MNATTKNQTQPKITNAEASQKSSNKQSQSGQTDVNKNAAIAEPINQVAELPAENIKHSVDSTSPAAIENTDKTGNAPEEPKKVSKADRAKIVYDEMVADPKNDKATIIAKIKKEVGVSKGGASTYYYKFQRESGRVTEKGPTKMDNAKKVFEKMTQDGNSRKEIIDAFIKEVGLTKAGASTYYQNLKKDSEQTAKTKSD